MSRPSMQGATCFDCGEAVRVPDGPGAEGKVESWCFEHSGGTGHKDIERWEGIEENDGQAGAEG